jgi:hypothetical protein
MTVTQDYKTIKLTQGERNAVEAALHRECAEIQSIIDSYPGACNFKRLAQGLLADLKSALAQVCA